MEPSAEVAAVADAVAALIRAVCAEHDLDLSALEAISVGLVGIPGLHPVAAQAETLGAALADEFGVHVLHGNNTRFAALAEATWGAGRRADDVLYVRWSTGVGGGFVLGGRAHVGANGAGAELGHVSVDPAGAECACGGRGCLELAIGGPALLARCRARGLAVDDLDELVAAARSRVTVACDVVASAAELLGQVVAGAVVQIDPELVIIGGELGQLGSLVLGPVRGQIDRLAMPRLSRRLAVVAADLGVSDAALGAVAHAVHATRGEPVRPTR
jgi:predicted NBD/HSP70 family sugar kinase